jgi:RNA polymerase sigma-70 factor (ECF subfamily)
VLPSVFIRRIWREGASLPSLFEPVLRLPLSKAECEPASIHSSIEREVVGLFDELRDRLLRYLLCLGLSAHDGEDVIQESFLLLFQHLQRGKSRENLRGWVFRVSRNLALKRRTTNHSNLQKLVEFDENFSDGCHDLRPNPEERLAISQRQSQLLAVVRALPEQDRRCLYLRAEGLRYREIAEALGISLGSVAASMARLLTKLGRVDGR